MKLNIFIYVLLAAISAFGYAAPNQVVFLDDFEAYTADQALLVRPAAVPPVGYGWANLYTPNNTLVVSAPASSGTKALQLTRNTTANGGVMALSTTTGGLFGGQDLLVEQHVYIPSSANTCENYYLYTSRSGWTFNGAQVRVLNSGTWVDTGVAPTLGAWNTIYAVLHVVSTGSGAWGGTYDIYMVKPNGEFFVLGKGLGIVSVTLGDSIARLTMMAGFNSTFYVDDVKMTGNYTAACGDAVHPIPEGDLNSDCKVSLADFAKLASNWMVCKPVACP